jgi:hypothetical protein
MVGEPDRREPLLGEVGDLIDLICPKEMIVHLIELKSKCPSDLIDEYLDFNFTDDFTFIQPHNVIILVDINSPKIYE